MIFSKSYLYANLEALSKKVVVNYPPIQPSSYPLHLLIDVLC